MSNYKKIEIDVGSSYTHAIRECKSGRKLVNIGIHGSALRDLLTEKQWMKFATDETNRFSVGKKKLEKFIDKHKDKHKDK